MTTTKRRLVRGSFQNILDCFERASSSTVVEGASWYPLANGWAEAVGKRVQHHHPIRLDSKYERIVIGAGIISALSPQTDWDTNKKMAMQFAESFEKPGFCTDANHAKALAIVSLPVLPFGMYTEILEEQVAKILNGNKTKAFFYNIINPDGKNNLPTIDRHAISIYLGRRCTYKELVRGLDGTANKTISNAYIKASKILECPPQMLQAVTWVQWRKELKGEI